MLRAASRTGGKEEGPFSTELVDIGNMFMGDSSSYSPDHASKRYIFHPISASQSSAPTNSPFARRQAQSRGRRAWWLTLGSRSCQRSSFCHRVIGDRRS